MSAEPTPGAGRSGDAEARAERAEEALREALEERNRLWAELSKRTADERELQHWRERAQRVEGSAVWKAARGVKALSRLAAEPKPLVQALVRRARERS